MAAAATSEANAGSRRPRVFISYARSDMGFADRLEEALRARGFETFIDRRDIADLELWLKRIQTLIVKSDTVVVVLSPSAIRSDSIVSKNSISLLR